MLRSSMDCVVCMFLFSGCIFFNLVGGLADFFFFSSRRRHTRLVSDWSSDVCSSDLGAAQERAAEPCQLRNVTEEVAGKHLEQLCRIELPRNAAALEQHLLGSLREPTSGLPPPLVERGDRSRQLAQGERVLRLNPLGEGTSHREQLCGAPSTGAVLDRREARLQREPARDAVGLTRAQGEQEMTREEVGGANVVDQREPCGHRPAGVDARELARSNVRRRPLPKRQPSQPQRCSPPYERHQCPPWRGREREPHRSQDGAYDLEPHQLLGALREPPVDSCSHLGRHSGDQRFSQTVVIQLESRGNTRAAQEVRLDQECDQRAVIALEAGRRTCDLGVDGPTGDGQRGEERARPFRESAYARFQHLGQADARSPYCVLRIERIPHHLIYQVRLAYYQTT